MTLAAPSRRVFRRLLNQGSPIRVCEDLLLPASVEADFDGDLGDLLRVMGRCPGCLDCSCRRAEAAPGGPCYRIESRWASGEAFLAWTETTLFAAIAGQLAGRRFHVEPVAEVAP